MLQSTGIRIIPPNISMAFIAVGVALHILWPAQILASPVVWLVGWALIALSVLPVGLALRDMRAADTTFDARKQADTLLTEGIFGLTRNPTYLAMQILMLGIALAMNSLVMLVMVWPCGTALCLAVIRKEEAFLAHKFGIAYTTYTAQVRRWI